MPLLVIKQSVSFPSQSASFSTMSTKEQFEADVLSEYQTHDRKFDPWFILLCIMYAFFTFCNDLPGGGVYARFLPVKYQRHRDLFDMACYAICLIVLSTLADLYGRRKVVCILSTVSWLAFIALTMSTYWESTTAIRVFFKIQYFLMPAANLVFFVNFLEFCEKYNKLSVSSFLLASALATETVMLHMDLVYRKTIISFALAMPVFITWYFPESLLWLLNKDKSEAALQLLQELSGKKPDIAIPKVTSDDVKQSQFKIWKGSMRYLFGKQWKNLLLFAAISSVTEICVTQVSSLAAHRSIPIRIPLSLFSILLIISVFLCMGIRISLIFLFGVICLAEVVHYAILFLKENTFTESVIIVWLQYVFVWATQLMTVMFLAEIFPTFVRVVVIAIFFITQHGITTVLQLLGIRDLLLTNLYWSFAKILGCIFMGICPLVFGLRESPNLKTFLPNQKLDSI